MFTDKKNVLELISLLKAHSIEHAVLCPGSRDIPIIQGISQFSDISCYFRNGRKICWFFCSRNNSVLKKTLCRHCYFRICSFEPASGCSRSFLSPITAFNHICRQGAQPGLDRWTDKPSIKLTFFILLLNIRGH